MHNSEFALEINGLTVSYGRKLVLSNIHLDLGWKSFYGVIGPNGAGKSSLFKSILGLIEPTRGNIKIAGGFLDDYRKKIAYVPQRDDIDWSFPVTVGDVVNMGRYPHLSTLRKMTQQDFDIVNSALKEMGIYHLKDRQIGQLSGGQQQRIFIARALAQEADIMLLDEPFVGVDMVTEDKIIKTLSSEVEKGKCVLVVHHDLSTVEEYFDHIILLNQRIISYGQTGKVFTKDNLAKTYRGQLNLLHKFKGAE